MSAKTHPKPGKDVIYIDVDDEITGIIDKIENSKEKVVALVLPKRATSLQSIVNMKLLKRSADQADKNPVLITSEAALLPLAGAAGLHVAKNLQSAPEIPHAPAGAVAVAAAKAGEEPVEDVPDEADEADEDDLPKKIAYGSATVGALAVAHEAENPETIDLDDEDGSADKPKTKPKAAKAPKDKKNKVPNFDRFRTMLGLGIGGFIALIVFIFLAIFVLPKATITITTASEPVSANFTITAGTEIKTLDTKKGQIPATQQTTDQTGSQSVTATGQQNNGQTATGSVTMTSQVCAPNLGPTPSSVPAGTGISSGGQNYITQKAASFTHSNPSGSCINYSTDKVDITAQAAGSKYNVSNGTFTVAGRPDVSASGSASGGTDNIANVVSQGDVDGAKQKIASANSPDDFLKTYKQKLQDQGLYVIEPTLKANDPVVTATPAVGQPASNTTVTVKTTYTVLTVKKDELKATVQYQLSSQIDKSKQKPSDDFLNDTTLTIQSQSSATSVTLAVSVNTTAVPIINPAIVKKVAAGKKTGDVKAVINGWGGVKAVDINLSPFWVSKIPNKQTKITVIIKEVKTGSNSKKSSAP